MKWFVVSAASEVIHQGQSEGARGMVKWEGGIAHVKWHMVMYVMHEEYIDNIDFVLCILFIVLSVFCYECL